MSDIPPIPPMNYSWSELPQDPPTPPVTPEPEFPSPPRETGKMKLQEIVERLKQKEAEKQAALQELEDLINKLE